jgi:predicted lipoprotein with Yx(FWY)xxD motif
MWRGRLALGAAAAAATIAGAAVLPLALGATAGAASSPHTVTISTGKVANVGTVLTTSSGLTLYRFTSDPSGQATCTGACAKVWPPMLLPKGDHLKGPRGVRGLATFHVGHGRSQVSFHGAALYRFSGDTKKGQAKGQGVEGTWFAALKNGVAPVAVTTTTAAPATATAPATVTPTTARATKSTTTPTPTTKPPAPTTTPTTQAPPSTTTTPTTAPQGGYGY